MRISYSKWIWETIRDVINLPILRGVAIILIIGAIVIGNAAYEGGNISGAVLGFEELFFNASTHIAGYEIPYTNHIGIIAFILLFWDHKTYRMVFDNFGSAYEFGFLTTAIVVQPDVIAVLRYSSQP